jgi:hypothetical protein
MVFPQFLSDLSDRQLEEQATRDLMCKCFLDLSSEEPPPDQFTLSCCRQPLEAAGFEGLSKSGGGAGPSPGPGAGGKPKGDTGNAYSPSINF